MTKYIGVRILGVFLTLLLVNAALFYIGRFVQIRFSDAEFMDKFVRTSQEYWVYLKNIVTEWYWGETKQFGPQSEHVWDVLIERSSLTIRLIITSFLFYTLFGILFGTLAALYKERLIDNIISFFILILSSVPAYITVMLLVIFFGYYLEWLPPINPSITRGWWYYLRGMIIPILAISGLPLARFTRLIRGEMIELFNSDYLMLLRTKGLSTRQMITRHFLKDAIVTLTPEMMPMVIYVMVTSFIVEKVYNVNGIAKWLFDSMFRPFDPAYIISINLPPMVIVGTFYTLITLLAGLFIDILSTVMDPRIRLNGKNITGF